MTDDYLPSVATADEVSSWASKRLGGQWNLVRILDCGVVPHVWIVDSDDVRRGRANRIGKGFLAPMIDPDDVQFLKTAPPWLNITKTRRPNGEPVEFNPPVSIESRRVRFRLDDVMHIVRVDQTGNGTQQVHEEIDPSDRPEELDLANQAHRAVSKGYGEPGATFRNRVMLAPTEN